MSENRGYFPNLGKNALFLVTYLLVSWPISKVDMLKKKPAKLHSSITKYRKLSLSASTKRKCKFFFC